jgi:DNA-binding transcriptional MerR regulator
MDYRIERLATLAGVRVDTVRFYQAQGLLPRPRRSGRHAVYSDHHLDRLRQIRKLKREGLPLGVIRRLLAPGAAGGALRQTLAEARGPRALTREELAAESGVPEDLIAAIEGAGLVEPMEIGTRPSYAEADVEMARAALALLGEGFPLQDLLGLAIGHAEHVRDLVDRAIDMFNAHVRRDRRDHEREPADVAAAFKRIMPAVMALVAHHFHRTLVARALARLDRQGQDVALKHALQATESARLEVAWR